MKRILFSFIALSLLGGSLSVQAKDTVVTDDFSAESLSENWAIALGKWHPKGGKLFGAEEKSDNHAAVAMYRSPHTDASVRVSFELAGSKGFHLSFNHEKGHLYRVIVEEGGVTLRMDKDKKDPSSKAENIAKKTASFEQGKTYVMTCETRGDIVSVSFDNDVSLSGTHSGLTKKKTGYRFIVRGDGVLFDDFAILSEE